jgi:hypothetical protein
MNAADVALVVSDPAQQQAGLNIITSIDGWQHELAMFDDGSHSDAIAGDFSFTTLMKDVVFGQTVQWKFKDSEGNIYPENELTFQLDENGILSGTTFAEFPALTMQDVMVGFFVSVSDSLEAGAVFNSLGIYGNALPLNWDWSQMLNPMTLVENSSDTLWAAEILFPAGTPKTVNFKFGRNGFDWEAPESVYHSFTISDDEPVAEVFCRYGFMGYISSVESPEASEKYFTVFPNPATGKQVNILSGEDYDELQISLRNAAGRIVFYGSYRYIQKDELINLDIHACASDGGLYFIEIRTDKNEFVVKLIVH